MKLVRIDREGAHLGRRDHDPCLVPTLVQFRFHAQPGRALSTLSTTLTVSPPWLEARQLSHSNTMTPIGERHRYYQMASGWSTGTTQRRSWQRSHISAPAW